MDFSTPPRHLDSHPSSASTSSTIATYSDSTSRPNSARYHNGSGHSGDYTSYTDTSHSATRIHSHAGQVAVSSSTSRRTRSQLSSASDNNSDTIPRQSDLNDSRFDSLQDLLERAGYKETRVVTPDRQTLAGMFAKKLSTPPRKPRLVDDFSSDSPSLAASELRRAIQKSSASHSTPKASSSKSLPSRNYKPTTRDDAPPLPNAPAASSGWLSNIWLFGPGAFFGDSADPANTPSSSSKEISTSDAPQQAEIVSPALTSASTSSSKSASSSPATSSSASTSASSTRPAPLQIKRTATKNTVWTASVAYRSAKSRTAPVRKSAAISSDVLSSDAAAEEAWKAMQNGASSGTAKRRPGLVDAFSSPTKQSANGKAREAQGSPSRQRKWRQERAAWRESLGDLQAMMDQSRMRREAAAAAVVAAAANETATVAENESSIATNETADDAHTAASPNETSSTPPAKPSNDDDSVTKLLSGPALPFLSTDPAVAPRNANCTKPAMRRMKSVEVLSKIMRERRASSSQSSLSIDASTGQISPTTSKRSTPPRLTVSSPRGISSPQELALEGQEFEPGSWSPSKCQSVIVSNRRVQKKPRSKLRHVSSGSDLRGAAAAREGLKMPKRGRSKTRTDTSPRGPVASLIRDSVGTLSRGSKCRELRDNVHVFDDPEGESGVDDSPTKCRSRQPEQRILTLSNAHNASDPDDIFRPTTTLKKKDFSARITRTSKIMRLIEEAENIPTVASMIPSKEAVPQQIATSVRQTDADHGLSSSLSKKSRDRMYTITRVLGQKQPLA